MSVDLLKNAIARVPAGAWAVGVSGGADSVALLTLAVARADLTCHAVHLDHETRGEESAGDARFVRELCASMGVPCTVAMRSDVERTFGGTLPRNQSARFRAARLHLFRTVCADRGLSGALLAHHADDQAETIVQRLLRGAGPAGLIGMQGRAVVGGLVVHRPLLDVPGRCLRDYLRAAGRGWREDASNASEAYQRNRVRGLLVGHPALAEAARDLGGAAGALVEWAREAAPPLEEAFAVARLADVPDVLAFEAARAWLAARGAPRDELSATVLARLVTMARDAATASRSHFPGRLLVARRRGRIEVVAERAPVEGM
jgi:tRNA(Ile)-lysidine synthetase-like protein